MMNNERPVMGPYLSLTAKRQSPITINTNHQQMRHSYYWITLLCAVLLMGVAGCRTSRNAMEGSAASHCLSSKVKLTIPQHNSVFTVNGTLKLKNGERMQVSFLMPILRTEVARIDLTPDEILLVDRMGKRYAQITREELKGILPRKADFAHLEKLLYKAARPDGKRILEGKDLGLSKLERGRLELYDFSNEPFELAPTKLSSRYKRVEMEEIMELLIALSL